MILQNPGRASRMLKCIVWGPVFDRPSGGDSLSKSVTGNRLVRILIA
jgi:hypothetical protein